MTEDRAILISELRRILNKLANDLGNDASGIGEDDLIPDAGIVDSAGLIDFVMQIDATYNLALEAEDMTIDNFGTFNAIMDFVTSRKAGQ